MYNINFNLLQLIFDLSSDIICLSVVQILQSLIMKRISERLRRKQRVLRWMCNSNRDELFKVDRISSSSYCKSYWDCCRTLSYLEALDQNIFSFSWKTLSFSIVIIIYLCDGCTCEFLRSFTSCKRRGNNNGSVLVSNHEKIESQLTDWWQLDWI